MAKTRKELDATAVDSGYSWVILFATTLVSFFGLGVVKVFGVFIPELVEQLQMSSSAVGLCCGIGIGLRAVLGTLASHLLPLNTLAFYFSHSS